MIWGLSALFFMAACAGLYLAGQSRGRGDVTDKNQKEKDEGLAEKRNIHHRLRHDADFARRVRDTFRR